jgi:(p)ppGpp synthase/HD superfamily hydrolase
MHPVFIECAEAFARQAHRDQKRKYTGEPYWHHCREVAQLVTDAGGTVEMICAAWLHDTVEDCGTPLEQLRATFGDDVAALVEALTDSTHDKGNRKTRKELDRARLAAAPAAAQTIKLADLISNTSSIVERDPDFAVVYLREKAALLEVMTKGHPALYERASSYAAQAA